MRLLSGRPDRVFGKGRTVQNGWIAVDFDGTLAFNSGWSDGHLGCPVPRMLHRVQGWLAAGRDVRLFTARVAHDPHGQERQRLEAWCLRYLGRVLPVTATKDIYMTEIWDDLAAAVLHKNTGTERSQSHPAKSPPPQAVKLLVDTDIGGDVDDALALCYLLRQPQCQVVGITTVTEDTVSRAEFARFMCLAEDRYDIPIWAGASRPLGQCRDTNAAVEFLNECLTSQPEQITLLTLGPLTNIALLFRRYPDAARRLQGIISMTGWFFGETRTAEYNVSADADAARTVMAAGVASHVLIGRDVTDNCSVSRDRLINPAANEDLEGVQLVGKEWLRQYPLVTFHDPLAAAVPFLGDTLCFARGEVRVENDGRTTFLSGQEKHLVAQSVSSEAFLQHYFDVIATKGN